MIDSQALQTFQHNTALSQGRRTFHSFSPAGRRWDEGVPAMRYGNIVAPSPHPLPLGERV
jgi:hypothetical protein